MFVAHFAGEAQGGVGVAANRLHCGLLNLGVQSRLFFDKGDCFSPFAERRKTSTNYLLRHKAELTWGLRYRLCKPGAGLFTSPHGVRATPLSWFGIRPDILDLHWLVRWVDQPSFFASIPADLPLVLSLHEMNPFTGGCHLWSDCERFTTGCHHCPQLRFSWQWDASARYYQAKKRAYQRHRLHIVGNSEWTTSQARRAALLRNAVSFETIPLGVDPQEFIPLKKDVARGALNLPTDKFVIGFGCADVSDANKNFAGLLAALRQLPDKGNVLLVAYGGGKPPEMPGDLRTIFLGNLSSSRLQSIFYSALDVFVMPSKMETFGLAALEAMACGTPVVAYRTGGIPDFLEDGTVGLLAPDVNDPGGLTERLKRLQTQPEERRNMGLAARQRVEKSFTVQLMSERYLKTYQNILLNYSTKP